MVFDLALLDLLLENGAEDEERGIMAGKGKAEEAEGGEGREGRIGRKALDWDWNWRMIWRR